VTTSKILLPLNIGLAAGALALGYGLDGRLLEAGLCLALGSAWLLGWWRHWVWVATPGLVLCSAAATVGLLLDLAAAWPLLGLVAALVAWDLDAFLQRLAGAARVAGQGDLERHHLVRLLIVSGLGLGLGGLALELRIDLGFGLLLLLGLLVVIGFSQVVGFLRRESE
jgi:hypothetical protein